MPAVYNLTDVNFDKKEELSPMGKAFEFVDNIVYEAKKVYLESPETRELLNSVDKADILTSVEDLAEMRGKKEEELVRLITRFYCTTKVVQLPFRGLKTQAETIMDYKQDEYAKPADRLHNFRMASKIANVPMSEVCYFFMLKHIVSALELTKDSHTQLKYEKLCDWYNCLILFKMCLDEESEEKGENRNAE